MPALIFPLRGFGGLSAVVSTGWPTVAEVTTRLGEAGIASADIPSSTSLQRSIDAAIKRFKNISRFFPFLSTGTEETRRFSPPESGVLKLKAGLLTLTSLTTHNYPNATATTLTVNEDFWLMPEDAAEKEEPYRWIEFRRWQHGLPRSIALVGKWGFSLTVPDDAWEAVMQLALAHALRLKSSAVSGGMSSWMEGNVQETYGVDGPYRGQIKGYEDYAREVALFYRRLMI